MFRRESTRARQSRWWDEARTSVALLLVAALVLSACAGAADEPEEAGDATTVPAEDSGDGGAPDEGGVAGEVAFRSWSPIDQTTRAMIEATAEEYPDVTIDATIFNYPEYLVDLQTRAASDTFADIVGLQPGALTQQYRDELMPLQQCAADQWGEDWQDQFYPIGIEQARLGNPEGDDNFYALPILVQTVNMWATDPLLEAVDQEIPSTWDEMAAVADAATQDDVAGFMLGATDGWLRIVVFMQIANNVEPGLVYQAEDGEESWTHPRIVEAFDWWRKLFADGIAQEGALALDQYPSVANAAEAGRAAMFPMGAWWVQQSDPAKTDAPELSQGLSGFTPFLFPTIPGGAAEPQYVGGIDVALGISKDSANPEAACAVLADWISGQGGQVLINTFNDLPAYQGLEPEEFTSDHQREVWETFTQDWMPKVEYSRYVKDPEVSETLENVLAAVAAGDMTPEEAGAEMDSVTGNG